MPVNGESITCPICNKDFIPLRITRIYCSRRCKSKARYLHDGRFRQEHIKKIVLLRDSLMRMWNANALRGRGISYNRQGKKAEHFILEELSRKGYTKLYCIADDSYAFPVDILGYKDGELHGFLVTTRFQAVVKEGTKRIARYLGARLFVVQVKPDLSRYYIQEVGPKKNYLPSYVLLRRDGLWPNQEAT